MTGKPFSRVAIVVMVTLLLFCCGCREKVQNWDKTSPYLYEDTKRLVSLVALSSASGATSRVIGYVAGCLFIVLGFFPKIGAVLSVMPMPVMGAILVFVTAFMILSGIQIILGSGVDARKIFIIGLPIIFGLSLDIAPTLFAGVPPVLRPLFDLSLTLTTVLAVLLNQLFRVREKKRPEGAPKPETETTEA